LKIPMAATLTTIGGPGKESDRDGSPQFSKTAHRSAEPTAKSGFASWQVSLKVAWTKLEQPRAQAPERPCRCREHVLLAPLEGDPGLASLVLREVHALRQAPPRQCPRGRQRPPHWPAVEAIPTVLAVLVRDSRP